MATEFTATVKAASGDYSTLSSAEAGLQNDLTAATIKVFSISAASSPTIAAGDTVLGLTSAATGTCVLVNAARTQILIKSIAISAFQSGETVQKTTDATKTVTLSNAGDSPIVGMACYSGLNDTTAVIIDGWTTGAANYIRAYCPTGEGHAGYWDTNKYNLIVTSAAPVALDNNEEYFRAEGLQVRAIGTSTTFAIRHKASGASQDMRLGRCLAETITTTGGGDGTAIWSDDPIAGKAVITAYDCIASAINTDFPNSTGQEGYQTNFGNIIAYNCDAIACGTGFKSNAQTSATYRIKAINCVGYCTALNANTVDFSGTMLTGTDYNASTDASATGAHSLINQSNSNINFTSTTKTNSGFCALGASSTLASAGINDPGSGLYSTDIRGANFVSTWDIGANARSTLTLTGVTGTGSVGTLVAGNTQATSGNAATASIGSQTPGFSFALASLLATGSVGSLGLGAGGTGLTGVGGVGSPGTFVAGLAFALSGVGGTGSVGSLLLTNSQPLSGVEGSGSVGTLGVQTSSGTTVALSGVEGSGDVGDLTAQGGAYPAVPFQVQLLMDGPRNTSIRVAASLGIELPVSMLVDPLMLSSIIPDWPTDVKASTIAIERIAYNVAAGLTICLWWAAPVPRLIITLTGTGELFFRKKGFLQNRTPGTTGQLLISSVGLVGNQMFALTMRLIKQGTLG